MQERLAIIFTINTFNINNFYLSKDNNESCDKILWIERIENCIVHLHHTQWNEKKKIEPSEEQEGIIEGVVVFIGVVD